MIAEHSGKDWTDAMRRFAAVRVRDLAELKLSGYVFKKNSPSCGMERVRVYSSQNMPARRGRGLFASAVMDRFPLMPVEEEGRLNDPALAGKFHRAGLRLSSLAGSAGGLEVRRRAGGVSHSSQIFAAGAQRAPLSPPRAVWSPT